VKTIVLFYTYSGNTKAVAEKLADKENADVAEIKDVKRPGKFKAYTAGCFAALELLPRGKTAAIKMVSSSGKSGCRERLEAAIKAKDGVLESFEDIKA